MRRFYATLFLLSGFLSSLAQSGAIEGVVLTQEGKGAPYANILVVETSSGTTTDQEGKFSINDIKVGNYTLQISSVGMQTVEQKIFVNEGQTTTFNVTLREEARQLNEIVIHDARGLNEQVMGMGKSPIKAFDLPQSVIAIDSKVLEEQQTLRVSDVLKNVSGVYTMGTTGGYQEEIAGRGFAFGSNNTFKNGIRFNNGIMPEVSSLERVEILKGSNAILFGNVAAGGVLNLVTKKPKFENGGEVAMRIGSYNFYKPSIDLYGPVNNSNTVAYRVNATYENAESFRDEVKSERIYINPSLQFKKGKTTILVESDYLHDERTPDYGIGAANYEILDVPRSHFLGAPWSNYEVTQKSVTLTAKHSLNNSWELRLTGGAQGFESDLYGTGRPTTINAETGNWKRSLQRSSTEESYFLGQVDLTGTFSTGAIKHTVLIGGDVDRYLTDVTGFNIYALQQSPDVVGNAYDEINVFDLSLMEQRTDIPKAEASTLRRAPIDRVGFYVQDFVSFSEKFKVLAGLRYSYMENRSKRFVYENGVAVLEETQDDYRYDDAFTPRFGIVYQPTRNLSTFASYANSFNLNTGSDINFRPLDPSMMDQYELGVKADLLDGLISVNLTGYQIVNKNLAQSVFPAPTEQGLNPAARELAGEVTSKGFELDVMTKQVKGFSFIAGYSYNDTRYTRSNIYKVGSKLRYNPAHTANFSTHYNVPANSPLHGLNAGLTLFYVGDMVAGRSTRLTVQDDKFKLIPLPSFLQMDASVGYTLNKASIRIRVTNIGNVLSYYAHDDNSINPVAPRQFSTTLSYKL